MSFTKENISEVSNRKVWTFLLPFLKPHRRAFGFALGLVFLSTSITIALPWLVGQIVDATINKDQSLFYNLAMAFISLVILEFIVDASKAFTIEGTGQKITHKLRSALFEHVNKLPVSYFDQNPVGRPLTRVINDIRSISELFTASLAMVVVDVFTIFGTIIAMFVLNTQLSLMVLAPFPIVILIIHFFGKRLAQVYRKSRRALSEINAFLGEHIGAIANIQRLGVEKDRSDKFENIVEDHYHHQMDTVRVFAKVSPLSNAINGITLATLIGVGGLWAIEGRISVGVIVAFIGFLKNLFQPVRDLVEKYNLILSAKVSTERVVTLFEEKVEIDTPTEGHFFKLPKTISFENVSFHYPTREKDSLTNISFKVKENSSLAIVGPTGSGKSTLIRLLLRFYEPSSGRILFGGQNLFDWNKADLRKRIGVVHQEIYLIEGTLKDNLTLGQQGFSDDFLIETCKQAELWPIFEMRGGLDSPVNEGGSNLSIGERQLISFARILLFDPPLLVLDEATSSMDRILEQKVLAALDRTLDQRTSIIIAHRLSTIQKANQILVMEEGKLSQLGNWDELLEAPGRFQEFYQIHQHS